MCKIILALVLAITATKEYVDRKDAAIATNLTARIEAATNALDTAVSGRGYLTSYTETDPTVPSWAKVATPPYLTSYTETDPTVPSWAKASSKPSYAYSEISSTPTTWAWSALTGLPTTLAGYGIADALSRTSTTMTSPGVYTEYLINGSLQGGVKIRYSSTSDANQTTYMYSGVAARRNGTTTDYLWDSTSQNGIVRRMELDSDYSTVSNLARTALQSYTETDPSVPSWAKAETKPSYTAAEVGAIANSGTQNLTGVSLNLFEQISGSFIPAQTKIKPGEIAVSGLHRLLLGNPNASPATYYRQGNIVNEEFGSTNQYEITLPLATGTLALTNDIPVAVSELTNDAGYLTEHQSLSGYATETWVGNQGYLTQHQSLSGYATENWVGNQGYLTAAYISPTNQAFAAAVANCPAPTPEGTNTVNSIPYWQAPVYCTVEDEATLSVSGTWPEGTPVFVRADTYGDYTPANNLTLVGYNAWPAGGSAFQACIWRLGSAYYCNIIHVEED